MFPILTARLAGQVHLLPVPSQMSPVLALCHAGSLLQGTARGVIAVEAGREQLKLLLPTLRTTTGLDRVISDLALFAEGKECAPALLGHMGQTLQQTAEFLMQQNNVHPVPENFDQRTWEKFEAQPTLPTLRTLSAPPRTSPRPASSPHHEVCAVCDTESPRGHKFCGECGNPFGKWMEEAFAKFCHECGQANKDPTSKIKSDNREVTTFVSDIRGFSLIGDILAPDQLAWLMERTLIESRRIITNLKGYVALFEGDKIVSFWDLYRTRGDAAKRAVAAACQIHRLMEQVNQAPEYRRIRDHYAQHPQVLAWKAENPGEDLFDIKFRIGINTGTVTRIVLDKPTAFGSSINIASRLEAMAPPGKTLIGRATRERLNGGFEVIPKGSAQVKNIQKPVEYFLVSRETPTSEDLVPRRAGTMAFVGREQELTFLRKVFQSMLAGLENAHVTGEIVLPTPEEIASGGKSPSRARLVVVSGEAGLGKTTLASRFLDQLGQVQSRVSFWTLRGDDLNVKSPDRAIAQVIRHKALIQSGDTLGDKRRKIISFVQTNLAGTDEEMEMHVQLLGKLLDVPFERPPGGMKFLLKNPNLLRERTLETLISLFERLSRSRPAIIVLEDLHWMDEGSLEYVRRILENLSDRPIMVLGLTRPHFVESPSPLLNSEIVPQIVRLPRLDDKSRQDLVKRTLDRPLTSEEWNFLSRQTDNTFLFGLLLSQLKKGITIQRNEITGELRFVSPDGEAVPVDAHEILQSDIDSLSSQERRLIEMAAIVGFEFSLESLEALFEADASRVLQDLVDKDFLVPMQEGRFQFRHAMQRDAVLRMTKGREKIDLHQRAARYLESLGSKDYSVIALHYDEGKVPTEAGSYYHRAADAARSNGHTEAALSFYRKAYEVSPDPLQKLRLLRAEFDLPLHMLILGERGAIPRLDNILQLSKVTLDGMPRPPAIETAWHMFRTARKMTYEFILADEKSATGPMALFRGFKIQRLLKGAKAIVDKEPPGSREANFLRVGIMTDLGSMLMRTGDLPKAQSTLLEALELARTLGSPKHQARVLTVLSFTAQRFGNYESGIEYAQEAVDLCVSEHDPLGIYSATAKGHCLYHMGCYDELEKLITETEAHSRKLLPNERPSLELSSLKARLLSERQKTDEAIALLETGLQQNPTALETLVLRLALIDVLLATHRTDQAEAVFKRHEPTLSRFFPEDLAQAEVIRAKLALAKAEIRRAKKEAGRAVERFLPNHLGNITWSGLEAFLVCAKAHMAAGDYHEALKALSEGIALLNKRSENTRKLEYRNSFLHKPLHAEMRRLRTQVERKIDVMERFPEGKIDKPFRLRVEKLELSDAPRNGSEILRKLEFRDRAYPRTLQVQKDTAKGLSAVDVEAPVDALLYGLRRVNIQTDARITTSLADHIWTNHLSLASFAVAGDDWLHFHLQWGIGTLLGMEWLASKLFKTQREFRQLLRGEVTEVDGAVVIALERDNREKLRTVHGQEIVVPAENRPLPEDYIFAPPRISLIPRTGTTTTILQEWPLSLFGDNIEGLSELVITGILEGIRRT